MIVIGYQGIGKSTLARTQKGFIDLESSNFAYNGKKPGDWHIYYCQTAEHLSQQGYVVMVSSHEPVRKWFRKSDERAIAICPDKTLKAEWICRLETRYCKTLTNKDFRALENAKYRYDENIDEIEKCGIPVFKIYDTDYDLSELIRYVIRRNPNIDFHCRQIDLR